MQRTKRELLLGTTGRLSLGLVWNPVAGREGGCITIVSVQRPTPIVEPRGLRLRGSVLRPTSRGSRSAHKTTQRKTKKRQKE